jgi:predicted regulator of amino acid metabolism with ACT domain
MTEGWIALHRKIYNSNDFGNQLEVAVFLYLVAMASHKPVQVIYRKKKLTLKRGEVSIAYKDLAKKFDISERKVRGIVKNLVHTKNLNQTLHKNLSIYTIVKYSKYQDVPVKTDQTLTDRTTTIYTNTTSIDKNKISLSSMTDKPKKITIPLLQDLKTKIIEKPKVKNEWEIAKERLDAQDYEKWVLHKLNS